MMKTIKVPFHLTVWHLNYFWACNEKLCAALIAHPVFINHIKISSAAFLLSVKFIQIARI